MSRDALIALDPEVVQRLRQFANEVEGAGEIVVADMLREAMWNAEALRAENDTFLAAIDRQDHENRRLRRERDSARASHEGQQRATLAFRQDWLDATARMDRLDAAVSALAAERDASRAVADALAALSARQTAETDALRDRLARAVAELDAAPDADPDKPSKRAMREVLAANTRAWAVLTEGRDPPSKRRAEDAPRDAGDGP